MSKFDIEIIEYGLGEYKYAPNVYLNSHPCHELVSKINNKIIFSSNPINIILKSKPHKRIIINHNYIKLTKKYIYNFTDLTDTLFLIKLIEYKDKFYFYSFIGGKIIKMNTKLNMSLKPLSQSKFDFCITNLIKGSYDNIDDAIENIINKFFNSSFGARQIDFSVGFNTSSIKLKHLIFKKIKIEKIQYLI